METNKNSLHRNSVVYNNNKGCLHHVLQQLPAEFTGRLNLALVSYTLVTCTGLYFTGDGR